MYTLIVDKKELSTALALCNGVSPRKSTLPVLQNTLFSIDGNGNLQLYATDLEVGLALTLPAACESENCNPVRLGSINTSNAKAALQAAKLPKKENCVTLEFNGATATLAGFALTVVEESEFPALPHPKPGAQVLGLAKGDEYMLDSITFAASEDQARPVLTGLNIYTKKVNKERELRFECADGFRLARFTGPFKSDKAMQFNTPAKAIKLVSKIAKSKENDDSLITIAFDEETNTSFWSIGKNADVIAGNIVGTYPDTDQVIPRALPSAFTDFNTAEMIALCEKVETLAKIDPRNADQSKNNQYPGVVVLAFDVDLENTVKVGWGLLNNDNKDDGPYPLLAQPKVSVGCREAVSIGLNATLLKEAFMAVQGDTCRVEVRNATTPLMIKSNLLEWFCLVMPCLLHSDKVQ